MERLCEQGHPHEVCGLMLGVADGPGPTQRRRVVRLVTARNLNAERPHDRYVLDPADFLRADDLAREAGLDVVGVYHSHPDHPSAPSATDLSHAQPGWSYPIAEVVAGRPPRVASLRSWVLAGQPGRHEFVAEEIDAG